MTELLDDKTQRRRGKLSGPVAVAIVFLGFFLLSLYFTPWVTVTARSTPRRWQLLTPAETLLLGEASGYDVAAGLWRGDWPGRINFPATSLCVLGGLIAPICIVAVVLVNRLGWLTRRRAWLALVVLGLVGVAVTTLVSQVYYPRDVIVQMRDAYVRARPVKDHASSWYKVLMTWQTDNLWWSMRLYAVLASVAAVALAVPALRALGEAATGGRLNSWLAKAADAKRAILGPSAEEAESALRAADVKAPGKRELLRGAIALGIICSACVLLLLYFAPWVDVQGLDSPSYGYSYSPSRAGDSTGFELATDPWGGDWPPHVSVIVLSFCMSLAPIVPVCIIAVVLANRLKRLTVRRTWRALLLLGLAGMAVVATPTGVVYPHLVKAEMGDRVYRWIAEGYVSPAWFDNLTLEFTFSLWSSFWAYAALAAMASVAVTFPKFTVLTAPVAPPKPASPPRPVDWPTKATGAKKVLTGRTVRWTLLALYVVTVLVLWTIWLCKDAEYQSEKWALLATAIFTQVVFVATTAGRDLFRPLGRPRLVVPVVLASLMMGILVVGAVGALAELFYWELAGWTAVPFLVVTWGIWAVAFFIYTRRSNRLGALKRLVTALVAGSLLETVVAAWAHAIVSRRPGCFVGEATSAAIYAGVCVGLWAFGPGIAILFLYARAQQMKGRQRPTPPAESEGGSEGPGGGES